MGQRFLFRIAALTVAMAMVVLGAGVALADELVNTLDTTVDNQWEQLNLTAGGTAQTVKVKVVAADEQGSGSEDGCNIDAAERLVANVVNSNTTAVRVSVSTLTFTACEQEQSFTATPLASGDAEITFSQHADTNSGGRYDFSNARFKVAVTGTTKSNQTITFEQPTSPQAYDATFAVSPTASSGLSVSLQATGPCSLSATTAPANVTMTSGSGDCTITASQVGDATYNAATSVTKSVTAQKAAQAAVTVASPTAGTYGEKLTPTASGGSGTGAVTFQATGTACSIATSGDDANKLLITSGTGDCSLTATKAGDANYLSRSSTATPVTIERATQDTLSVTGPTSGKYNETKDMTSSGGSGTGTVSFEVKSTSTTACQIESGQLKITSGTGDCEIRATKAGDSNFNPATSGWHLVAVYKNTATMSLGGLAKTYNGSAQSVTVTTTPAGLSGVTVTYDGSLTPPTNAGSYAVVASLDHSNYEGPDATGTLVISPKGITGDFTADNKVYDGTTAATVLDRTLAGVVDGDSVTLTGGTAAFATAAVGTGKTVTLTGYSLSGGAGNYTLTSVDTATADITSKEITGDFTADNKVYDGTAAATVVDRTLEGKITGDDVSLTGGTATFDTAVVGTGKTVTLTGYSLSGGAAGNYTLTSVDTAAANITAATLTVTASNPGNVIIGAPVPTITPIYTGFVNNEAGSATTIVTTAPECGTDYTVSSTVGTFTTTCSGGAATNYELRYVEGSFKGMFGWSGFLQPMNNTKKDETQSKFKLGSTIPVKFQLLNSSKLPVQQATAPTFERQHLGGACESDTEAEIVTATTATQGGTFRWDATSEQYVYNFSTKGLPSGEWRVKAILADGSTGNYTDVCIK